MDGVLSRLELGGHDAEEEIGEEERVLRRDAGEPPAGERSRRRGGELGIEESGFCGSVGNGSYGPTLGRANDGATETAQAHRVAKQTPKAVLVENSNQQTFARTLGGERAASLPISVESKYNSRL